MSLDLYTLIFREILKVAECSAGGKWGCITGDVTQDFIYAFLLPHVVLFIFLVILSKPVKQIHKGLGILFGLSAYIFVIYEGWYGTILAPLLMWWLVLSIVVGLVYFFVTKFIGSPKVRGKIGKSVGGKIKEGMKKDKALRQLQNDIRRYEKKLEHADSEKMKEVYAKKVTELKEKRKKIEREGL
ncbi:MAG: hypothetical protein ACLFQ8_01365 [Candidatus Aenigmatarchaeota archaeon]